MWTFRQSRNALNENLTQLYQNLDTDLKLGQHKQVLKTLQQLQKRYPQDPRWMTRLGIVYEHQSQKCLAYHWYLSAAEKNYAAAFYHLGCIEMSRHNHRLAEHYLKQATLQNYAHAFLALGEMYFQISQYQFAIEAFKKALEQQVIEAWLPLSRIYLILKDFKQAKLSLEAAFEHDLTYSAHYLGVYYQSLHRYSEAKDWYTYAFQVEKNLTSLENLGKVFCSEGQILYGETLITIAQKLDQQQALNHNQQQLLDQILGYLKPKIFPTED
ncbi:tetratricopeptide repeat protein [Acinetobacter sp. MD2]|uniref:tetratricopeptide repeat protein n=1 Tax=Acinetobacter sp. MD2 TaxID=2600066 RepID=UPI002D1ECD0A|nr:tetratricopeptide repeat protein [Acinetobacter sp. MD2]MEB3766524.1 hypothetical protein [Acinetobacter sp. MD2]